MLKRLSQKVLLSALVFFCFNFHLSAQVTKRIYLVGNSVTDGMNYGGFANIALSRGNTHIYGRNMIPGAPLELLWSSTSAFSEAPYGIHTNALPNYTWDAVSLQPFDRPIDGANGDLAMFGNFINEAKGKSPNVQFYVYSRYPRKPQDATVFDANLWEKLWLGTYTGNYQSNETRKYFEDLLLAERAKHTDVKPALIVPVGEVLFELNKRFRNNEVPGFSSAWDLYSDGIHVTNVGSYVVAATFYATMYREDIRNSDVPYQYGSIPAELASVIQNTVHNVVFGYQYSGATASDLVKVTGVAVSPKELNLSILQINALSATVSPTNAANKSVTWSSSNTGIVTVDTKGKIKAVGNGTAYVIVKTSDGGFKDSCKVNVTGTLTGTTVKGTLAEWSFIGAKGMNTVISTKYLNGVSTSSPSLIASIGSGLKATGYVDNTFTATSQTTLNLKTSLADKEYFSFKVAPVDGKLLTIDSLMFTTISQNRTRTYAIYSSVKGFALENIIDSVKAVSGSSKHKIKILGHSNVSDSIEFRVFVYGYNNTYEATGFANSNTANDFSIFGKVFTPDPISDTQAPTTPGSLAAIQVKDVQLTLNWNESMDDYGLAGYNVYKDGVKINSALLTETSIDVKELTSGVNYKFSVEAVDEKGNISPKAEIFVMTNRKPIAAITATTSASSHLTYLFSATESTDPDTEDFILGYEWNFGDGSPLEISNRPTHTYAKAGNYIVTLRVMDNRNFYSEPVTKTINISTSSINVDNKFSKALSIFPNPSNGKNITIVFNGIESKERILSVMDLSGRVITSMQVVKGDNNQINLESLGLENGIYLLKISSNDSVFVERLVIE